MDLGEPVFDGSAFDLAVAKGAFEGDELALLESLGEFLEIAPGIDAMPFGAGFLISFVIFPAFLSGDVEDNELAIVLSGFGFCVLTEAADEGDFVEHDVRLLFLVCPLLCGTRLANGCAVATHSLGDRTESVEGDQSLPRVRSPHLVEARSGIWEGERASEGRGCFERGTLNADKNG